MADVFAQAQWALQQAGTLLENEVVKTAALGFFGWLKTIFKSKKKKIEEQVLEELLETKQLNEEYIQLVETSIKKLAEQEQQFRAELEERLSQLQSKAQEANIGMKIGKNTAIIKGEKNVAAQGQQINGDFTINIS